MHLIYSNLNYVTAQNFKLALDVVKTFLHFEYLREGTLPNRLCFQRSSLRLTLQRFEPPVHRIEASVHAVEAGINGIEASVHSIEASKDALFK